MDEAAAGDAAAPVDAGPDFEIVDPRAVVAGATDAGHQPPVGRVRDLASAGHRVLVRCDPDGDVADDVARVVATVAVYAWAGARVFATAHPREARQAVDMVAAVLGLRPPAVARRGLA